MPTEDEQVGGPRDITITSSVLNSDVLGKRQSLISFTRWIILDLICYGKGAISKIKREEKDILKQRGAERRHLRTHSHIHTLSHTHPTHTLTSTAVFLFWLIALRCTFHLQNIMKNKYIHLSRGTDAADNPESWRRAPRTPLLARVYYSFFFAAITLTSSGCCTRWHIS